MCHHPASVPLTPFLTTSAASSRDPPASLFHLATLMGFSPSGRSPSADRATVTGALALSSLSTRAAEATVPTGPQGLLPAEVRCRPRCLSALQGPVALLAFTSSRVSLPGAAASPAAASLPPPALRTSSLDLASTAPRRSHAASWLPPVLGVLNCSRARCRPSLAPPHVAARYRSGWLPSPLMEFWPLRAHPQWASKCLLGCQRTPLRETRYRPPLRTRSSPRIPDPMKAFRQIVKPITSPGQKEFERVFQKRAEPDAGGFAGANSRPENRAE